MLCAIVVGAGLASCKANTPAPASGGRSSPRTATSATDPTSPSTHRPAPAKPASIAPLIHPSLPGEGGFHPSVGWVGGGSPVQLAWYRSDPSNPAVRATIAWIDPTRTQLALYPGSLNPPAAPGLPQGPTMVPPSARSRLLATFNSGFYLTTPYGSQPGSVAEGFAVNGKVYSPMLKGLATFVAHADGRVDVVPWTGGSSPGPDVVFARQNLPMMVAHGRPSPLVSDMTVWGERYRSEPLVWRTAVGVDAKGHLIYVAAPDQTPASLAAILVHVGCVRAMELDINGEWPLFISYEHRGGGAPRFAFPNLNQVPTRFTTPGEKDFFAVYLRKEGTLLPREPF
jgi:hypothetical protein